MPSPRACPGRSCCRFWCSEMEYRSKQMLIVRRDLKMRKGKIAAQASHAAVEAVLKAIVREGRAQALRLTPEGWVYLEAAPGEESPLTDWFRYGMAKICVYVDSEEALLDLDRRARAAGVTTALIQDAGLTEFHGQPTFTALAFEPLKAERADALTGELPLY